MRHRRGPCGGVLAVALLACALRPAAAQSTTTFVTSLSGLGSVPIGLTPLTWPGVSVMTLHLLNTTDPLAVCNDGSPGGYYIAPGSNTSTNLWLVYMEGSMFCWDQDSCNERYASKQYWMGSSSWATQQAQYGIFNTDLADSAWAQANRVYVKYCSSDLWSGDTPASPATWGYSFRGARIARAVITSLVAEYGMGSTPGQRLLFGGCSAGAIGAMNNIDDVAAMVPPGLQVQGLLDASSLIDIRPTGWQFSNDLIPLQTLISEMVGFVQPTFDAACAAKYSGVSSWKCLLGQYRMPLLTTPYFANIVQIDDFEIQYDTDNLAPQTPAQYAFIAAFQQQVLALIASLPAGTGVFSPTCLAHCLSGQSSFQALKIGTWSMSTALEAWYFGNQPVSVISPCQGWNCTQACGTTNNGIPCNIGTGYKATQCYPISLPTGVVDEPRPANSTTGVAIPGDQSSTDFGGTATPSVTSTLLSFVTRAPATTAPVTAASARAAAAGPLGAPALGALGVAGAAPRRTAHSAMVLYGAFAAVVAALLLCYASQKAVKTAMPADRRPLLPQQRKA